MKTTETRRQALTLAVHTRAVTTEVSDGRKVFAVAADSVYGIDAVTGTPLWRRVIGLNTPFAPIAVPDGSRDPGV